ncbi:MAG: nucleotidyl transferase AbiEii/AbiGii toxin family protein [Ferruginibacter sp.]
MAADYLHNHKDFESLLRIVAEEKGIIPGLVEKDYWLMHVLNGLQLQQFSFELKGGTSLSKGYKVIDRFSEDIDIHFKPPAEMGVNENLNNTKAGAVQKRKEFYDWLGKEIKIDGIINVTRDTEFDEERYYRSGGIRLYYDNKFEPVQGIKEGILLEAGFDTVTPNHKLTLSSWALDKALGTADVDIINNMGVGIDCYDKGYTFVEKLQTIATKFRNEQTGITKRPNFMRQYYDLACLLKDKDVLEFIGTAEYVTHKKKRFPAEDLSIAIKENQAFLLEDNDLRKDFKKRYEETASLYHNGQPPFEELLSIIQRHLERL